VSSVFINSVRSVLESFNSGEVTDCQECYQNSEQTNRGRGSEPSQTTNQARPNQKDQQATSQGSIFRLRCFRCGELGYQISEYSKLESRLRKNLLVEKETSNFTKNKDDSNSDVDVLHGDSGTTLVIRKSLLAPKGDSDED